MIVGLRSFTTNVCLLFQLGQHFMHVLRPRKTIHDFQLGEFDVDGIIVFAEEDLDFVLQNRRSPLDDQQDIPQSDVLDFRTQG